MIRIKRLCAAMALAAAAAAGSTGAAALPAEFGMYTGAACVGRDKMPAAEKIVGRRIERTVDALDQASFSKMYSSIDWVTRCWSGTGKKLTLSVPMLPFDRSGTMKNGVAGSYDYIFRRVATLLVRDGHADAIVRIGWEFNGDWMPWAAGPDPKTYVAYYRRIVQIMRTEKGQRFRFEWTPNIGSLAIPASNAWPGDDVVDIIGMDVYDGIYGTSLADPNKRFDYFINQPFGLAWHAQFAAQHKKPMAYSEWGVGTKPDGHGGGDNPVFVNRMAQWFAVNNVVYQNYWNMNDYNGNTSLTDGHSPRAQAAYIAAFKPK